MDNPFARSQLLFGKEACATVLHRQQRLAVHGAFKVETEEVGLVLAEEMVDLDIVTDHITNNRQTTMESHHGIEQTIDGLTLADEVDPQVTGEKEVGLACFNSHAGGNAAAIKIPAICGDIMFRHHPATGHRKRLALNCHDAVYKHQRLIGQTDAGRIIIDFGKLRPEHLGDRTDGKLHAHFTAVKRGLGAGG